MVTQAGKERGQCCPPGPHSCQRAACLCLGRPWPGEEEAPSCPSEGLKWLLGAPWALSGLRLQVHKEQQKGFVCTQGLHGLATAEAAVPPRLLSPRLCLPASALIWALMVPAAEPSGPAPGTACDRGTHGHEQPVALSSEAPACHLPRRWHPLQPASQRCASLVLTAEWSRGTGWCAGLQEHPQFPPPDGPRPPVRALHLEPGP